MYFWQNISILLAYDVLVTAACQKLTPFWGTVYDNNNKDNEDNNDNDDNDMTAAAAMTMPTTTITTEGSADSLLVSFLMRPDYELYKHKVTRGQHLKHLQWPHLQIPQAKYFHFKREPAMEVDYFAVLALKQC